MNKRMAVAAIPVPPSPVLEQAVGYENNKGARYLALWWEPGGDEAMVSDGYVTFTGHWPGYLAYVHHPSVYPYLVTYNLGSSDDLAEYRLVIDLQERQAFVCPSRRIPVDHRSPGTAGFRMPEPGGGQSAGQPMGNRNGAFGSVSLSPRIWMIFLKNFSTRFSLPRRWTNWNGEWKPTASR